jgi:hypothetical protein
MAQCENRKGMKRRKKTKKRDADVGFSRFLAWADFVRYQLRERGLIREEGPRRSVG